MKQITFSVEEELLEQAQLRAISQGKTLNDLCREWLQELVAQSEKVGQVKLLMRRLRHVKLDAGSAAKKRMSDKTFRVEIPATNAQPRAAVPHHSAQCRHSIRICRDPSLSVDQQF